MTSFIPHLSTTQSCLSKGSSYPSSLRNRALGEMFFASPLNDFSFGFAHSLEILDFIFQNLAYFQGKCSYDKRKMLELSDISYDFMKLRQKINRPYGCRRFSHLSTSSQAASLLLLWMRMMFSMSRSVSWSSCHRHPFLKFFQ